MVILGKSKGHKGDGIPADFPRPQKQRHWLVDWPCHFAERTELTLMRPVSALSWSDWHRLRYDRSGDARELVRMKRHEENECIKSAQL